MWLGILLNHHFFDLQPTLAWGARQVMVLTTAQTPETLLNLVHSEHRLATSLLVAVGEKAERIRLIAESELDQLEPLLAESAAFSLLPVAALRIF